MTIKKIKIIILLAVFLGTLNCAQAFNVGTYKTQTDYGLIDGFKFNVFGKREGEKMIELKSETKEGKEQIEREKNNPVEQDEYQLFRFIQENTVPF